MRTNLRTALLASMLSSSGSALAQDLREGTPASSLAAPELDRLAAPGVDVQAVLAVGLPPIAAPYLVQLQEHTRGLLAEAGLPGEVNARVKSVHSARAKMARKQLHADALLDRLGLRVRVDDEDSCYAVRDLLRASHLVVPGSEDDYIARPKASGYQSLHTAVRDPHTGLAAEFQIRSHAMHHEAEHGRAAHWRYKLHTS